METKLTLKTNFSSPVNDHAAASKGIQKAANGPQNLVSYSLDPPNSFPQPTSIPAIDTLSATWPTPMRSIDDEMNDMEATPTLQPIGNEMSSEEQIPEIEGISSVWRIPLGFEEEAPWERSHAISGNATSGHASSVNKSREKLDLIKSRNATVSANARRRENVAANPRDLSKDQNILHSSKLTGFKLRRRTKIGSKVKSKLQQTAGLHATKRHEAVNTLHPCSFTNIKKSRKRVAIPPPKPIDPIQPLLENFQKEKAVGDINEHTIDMEKIKPCEAIDKHLVTIESQDKIEPIEENLSKDQPAVIEPIGKHLLAASAE